MLEFGHGDVAVHLGPYKGKDDHERVIEVPIEVSSGEVVIGGPEEYPNKHIVKMPKGALPAGGGADGVSKGEDRSGPRRGRYARCERNLDRISQDGNRSGGEPIMRQERYANGTCGNDGAG